MFGILPLQNMLEKRYVLPGMTPVLKTVLMQNARIRLSNIE